MYKTSVNIKVLCADAGYTSCCTEENCEVSIESSPISCFCDALCHSYGDCCSDILDIGCTEHNGELCSTGSFFRLVCVAVFQQLLCYCDKNISPQPQNHAVFFPILHLESLEELIRCPFQHLTMVYLHQLMWLFQLDIALNPLFKYVNVSSPLTTCIKNVAIGGNKRILYI